VAPGDAAQISERHSWVRVAYPSSEIAGAPVYDCDQELDGDFERTVYEHYGVEDFQPHNELRYMASRR
jgi:hypothetical protein